MHLILCTVTPAGRLLPCVFTLLSNSAFRIVQSFIPFIRDSFHAKFTSLIYTQKIYERMSLSWRISQALYKAIELIAGGLLHIQQTEAYQLEQFRKFLAVRFSRSFSPVYHSVAELT